MFCGGCGWTIEGFPPSLIYCPDCDRPLLVFYKHTKGAFKLSSKKPTPGHCVFCGKPGDTLCEDHIDLKGIISV